MKSLLIGVLTLSVNSWAQESAWKFSASLLMQAELESLGIEGRVYWGSFSEIDLSYSRVLPGADPTVPKSNSEILAKLRFEQADDWAFGPLVGTAIVSEEFSYLVGAFLRVSIAEVHSVEAFSFIEKFEGTSAGLVQRIQWDLKLFHSPKLSGALGLRLDSHLSPGSESLNLFLVSANRF